MLYTVVDHATKELTDLSTSSDDNHLPVEMCSFVPTPDPAETPSDSTSTPVETPSDSTSTHHSDDCDEAVIIAPIVSVTFVSAIVICCIVIFAIFWHWKREENVYPSRKRYA